MTAATTSAPARDASHDQRAKFLARLVVAIGCVVALVLVGAVDVVTGIEARIFPLYYLPIAVGAVKGSRAFGMLLALLSTAFWALAANLSGSTWSTSIFILNTTTQLVSFVAIAQLVSSLAHRFEVERDLSRTDKLTSLPNRRAFHEIAEVLLAGARRTGRPFSLAYLDLDNFKKVNDDHGHLQGDLALKKTAEILCRATRACDVKARLGGDEFTIYLPDTGPDVARTVLERLRTTLATAMDQGNWPITASIGALSFVQAPATLEEALHSADSLMYRAKQAGRNQVHLEVIDAE